MLPRINTLGPQLRQIMLLSQEVLVFGEFFWQSRNCCDYRRVRVTGSRHFDSFVLNDLHLGDTLLRCFFQILDPDHISGCSRESVS